MILCVQRVLVYGNRDYTENKSGRNGYIEEG